jgi:hypothetical protein
MNKNDNLKSQNKQNTVDTRRTKLDTSIDTNKIQDNKSRGPTGPTGSIEQVVKKQEGPTGSIEQVVKKQEGPTGSIEQVVKKQEGPTGTIEQVVKKQEGPTGSIEQVVKKQEGPTGNISKPITTPINLNGPIRFVSQSNTAWSSASSEKVNIQNRNNQKTFTIDEPITEDNPIIEDKPISIWEKLWSYFRK